MHTHFLYIISPCTSQPYFQPYQPVSHCKGFQPPLCSPSTANDVDIPIHPLYNLLLKLGSRVWLQTVANYQREDQRSILQYIPVSPRPRFNKFMWGWFKQFDCSSGAMEFIGSYCAVMPQEPPSVVMCSCCTSSETFLFSQNMKMIWGYVIRDFNIQSVIKYSTGKWRLVVVGLLWTNSLNIYIYI